MFHPLSLLLVVFLQILCTAGLPLKHSHNEQREHSPSIPFRLKISSSQFESIDGRYVVPFIQPNGAKYALAFPTASGHYTLDSTSGVLYYHDHQLTEPSIVSVGHQEKIGDVKVMNTKPMSKYQHGDNLEMQHEEQQVIMQKQHTDAFSYNLEALLTHHGASHWYACELTMAINYPFPLIAYFDHKPEPGCRKVELEMSYL